MGTEREGVDDSRHWWMVEWEGRKPRNQDYDARQQRDYERLSRIGDVEVA